MFTARPHANTLQNSPEWCPNLKCSNGDPIFAYCHDLLPESRSIVRITTPEPPQNHRGTTLESPPNHAGTTPEPLQNHSGTTPEPLRNHSGTTLEPTQKRLQIYKINKIEGFEPWDPSREKERAKICRKLKSRASETVWASSYGQITDLESNFLIFASGVCW